MRFEPYVGVPVTSGKPADVGRLSTSIPKFKSVGAFFTVPPYTRHSILAYHTSQRMRVIKHQYKITKISYMAAEARHLNAAHSHAA